MNQSDKQKIQQSIALLQSILGGSSDSPAPSSISVPGFEQEVNNFTNIANKLQAEIKQLNNALVQAISFMEKIMSQSTVSKKPQGPDLEKLQNKFQKIALKIDSVAKNPNYNYHCKAVRQLMSAHFWVFVDAPEYVFKGAIQSADFNALKFLKLKNAGHNDWWKSIVKAYKILQSFVKSNYSMGLNYNGAGNNKWESILEGGSSQHSAPQQSHHSHTHTAPKQASKPVHKSPKRQMQGLNWLVANFQNEKVVFKQGQIQMKHGAFIENCNDTVVIIQDKLKSVQMNKCKNVTLVVYNCVSGVQIINSQKVNLHIKGFIPSIAVDKSLKVRIILNEKNLNVDIVSSKVTQLQISYEKQDGNQAKDQAVSQQLITRWNPQTKKFETKIYDKFL